MKVQNKSAESSPRNDGDKRLFIASLAIFLVTCVLVFLVNRDGGNPQSTTIVTATPAQRITLVPEVIANLTQAPDSEALGQELIQEIADLRDEVATCSDYSPARREQMNQHITWLLDTSTLPRDMVIALGSSPFERLIFGMATYTSAEWGLHDKSPTSCLLTIGRQLNGLLENMGAAGFEEFN